MICQIDPTGIITEAAKVQPGDGSAYGWLIVVLAAFTIGLGYALVTVFKRMNKIQDKHAELVEKSIEVNRTLAGVVEKIDDRMAVMEGEQRVQTALMNTYIQKNGN